ncbi:MAG: hypothetical protein H0W73_02620 [Bacteroidetes bacterium]|nr:hypothetical protein [Bacteroidota bacterium]
MTEYLDIIYSSFILLLLIAFILLFLFIFLSTKKPFKNNTLNKFYKMLMYACSIAFFVTIPASNFGHARSFEKICIGEKTICVFEPSIRAIGKSVGKQARLNIIDKATGIRIERFSAGKPGKLVDMHNDTICYMEEKDIVLYDAANLKEVYRIKEDAWGNILAELSVGIESINITDQNSDYPVKHFIRLDCLNGKKYWYEPFSKAITNKQPADEYLPGFSDRTTELSIKYAERERSTYLVTANSGEGNLQCIFPGRDAGKFFSKVDSTNYISPFLLCIDTVKRVFVFGHYLTTKKEEFYLEAKDFDYHTKWKKLSTEIVAVDEDTKINIWLFEKGILYIGIGGYVLAIEPLTFKPYWTTQL